MDKKTQDLAWACLPKEVRDFIKSDTATAWQLAYARVFGHHNLTSDTEPETKDNTEANFVRLADEPEKKPAFVEQSAATTIDSMEEKELNLCELLKGCEGEKFWSQIWGEVILNRLHPDNNNGHQPLVSIKFPNSKLSRNITADGYLSYGERYGYCILWPSKELYEKYPLDAYSAWMEWKEARKPKYLLEIEKWFKFDSATELKQAIKAVREALQKFHKKNTKQWQ